MERAIGPAAALLPLRGFLGVTFIYAGVQKLSDPGFLTAGSQTYIGAQLRGFASATPGGGLLRTFALPHPELAGVGVAVAEIAIGVLALLGLATRAAALAGLSLNLVLFLTASWHTRPYFLGPDIVFVFAWLPIVLAGTAGQPALEHAVDPAAPESTPVFSSGRPVTRREMLAAAWSGAAAAVALIAGTAAAFKGAPAAPAAARADRSAWRGHHHRQRQRAGAKPARGVPVASSGQLAPGSSALYPDPAGGEADIVVRHANGTLSACSAICTHAGCRVEHISGVLLCPCHGSVFDSRTGAVRRGPATEPLAVKRVSERAGTVYALPS